MVYEEDILAPLNQDEEETPEEEEKEEEIEE